MRDIHLPRLLLPGLWGLVALLGACAPTVPPELANARRAYSQAAHGVAAQTAPAEVHKARRALDAAERAFEDKPSSQLAVDLAYVAERKAQEAEAIGQTEQARAAQASASQAYTQLQSQLMGQTQQQLAQTRAQLAESERNARAAQARLADVAKVKHEDRGMVITLTGSVLFPSNQSTLLPEASERLDQVATALMSSKERKIVIEGYTDSRGSDEHNMELSRRRAEAVRAYLVAKGYDGDLVVASGLGEARPVATNATAEGRANNRRVEIVVKNKGE